MDRLPLSPVLRFGLLLFFATTALSQAAVITVDTHNDVVDGNTSSIANLIATPGSDSNISLREAITAANNTPGSDEIFFSDSLAGTPIVLNIGSSNEDNNVDGDLDITDPNGMSIEWFSNASAIVIDGNNSERVFDHHEGRLYLFGLTIRNGNSSLPGGGIRSNVSSSAELIIENSTVTNNTAQRGGGIYTDGPLSRLTVNRCIFSNNQADYGGGINLSSNFQDVITDIQASLFSNNIAMSSGGAIAYTTGSGIFQIDRCLFVGNQTNLLIPEESVVGGGAFFTEGTTGTILISYSSFENNTARGNGGAITRFQNNHLSSDNNFIIDQCSITGNSAGFDGGGIFDFGSGSPHVTMIRNTTISDNQANRSGGGLYSRNVYDTLLNFVTMTDNTADNDNDGTGDGGGIYTFGVGNEANIQNSIIQGNIDKSTPANNDCFNVGSPAPISLGGNVFGLNTGCPVTGSDTTGAALLGPLQANGGPLIPSSLPWIKFKPVHMPTHALLPGSAAIDFATCGSINMDQRNHARADGNCDAGAFEDPLALIVTTANDVVDSDPNDVLDLVTNPGTDGKISLREAITASNISPWIDTITFDPNTNGVPIVLDIGTTEGEHIPNEGQNNDGDLDIDDSTGTVIIGNGQNNTIIDGNDTERVIDHRTGDLTLSDLTIRNGRTQGFDVGSGIRTNECALIMNRCTVSDNLSSTDGGAIVYDNSSFGIVFLNDSMFLNNISNRYGGAMFIGTRQMSFFMDGCSVAGNQSLGDGGGIFFSNIETNNANDSFYQITHSVIANNSTTGFLSHGGGIAINGGSLEVAHSQISSNQANDNGGGISTENGTFLNFLNSTISNNQANEHGGGLALLTEGNTKVADFNFVTMTNNNADNDADGNGDGGGIYVSNATGTVNIQNSIVQGNDDKTAAQTSTDDCANTGGGALNSLGGNVFGLSTGCPVTIIDTTGAALLGPLQDNGGITLTHALQLGSAAIDHGGCGDITSDQIDQPRDGEFCDSGAFELRLNFNGDADLNADQRVDMIDFSLFEGNFGCTGFCIADLNSDGAANLIDFGLFVNDWLRHVFTCANLRFDPDLTDVDLDNIPDICECEDGSEDCVVNTTSGVKYSTIQAAIDAASNADDIVVFPGTYNETIDFSGKDITLRSVDPNHPFIVETTIIDCDCPSPAEDQNVVSFISGESNAALLAGFTIQGAKNQVNTGTPGSLGGGIRIDASSSPTIKNCIIKDNEIITGNADNQDGGGIFVGSNCFPIIQNCKILNNTAGNRGGGIYVQGNSRPEVTNTLIAENTAGATPAASKGFGGGVYCQGGNPFNGDDSGYVALTNCTIANNVSRTQGAGVDVEQYDDQVNRVDIINCIIYHNTLNDLTPSSLNIEPGRDSGFYSVTYSNIEGGFAGTGNINSDPNFVDLAGGDYDLSLSSPCIDAGDNTAISLLTDINSHDRKFDVSTIADTGNGTAPIVDMGADELTP